MKFARYLKARLSSFAQNYISSCPRDGVVCWWAEDGTRGRHAFKGLMPAEVEVFVRLVTDRQPLMSGSPTMRALLRYRVTRLRLSPGLLLLRRRGGLVSPLQLPV